MKIMKLKKRTAAGVFAALLLLATWLNTVGCSMNANAADLMEGIRAGNVTGKQADAAFISESANFAIELRKVRPKRTQIRRFRLCLSCWRLP